MSAILLNATVCDFSSPPPLPFAEAMGIHIIYLFIHALHFTLRPHSYTYSEYIACLAWAWFFSSCTKWILNIIKLNANEKGNNKNMNRKKKKYVRDESCYCALSIAIKPSLLTIRARCVADIINIRRQTQTHTTVIINCMVTSFVLFFFLLVLFCFTARLLAIAVFSLSGEQKK